MARRKNTAEAFEILLRIAEEEKAKRTATVQGAAPPRPGPPAAAPPAGSAGSSPPVRPALAPSVLRLSPSFPPRGREEPLLGRAPERAIPAAPEVLPGDEDAGSLPGMAARGAALPAGPSPPAPSRRPAWHARRGPAAEPDLTQPPARLSRLGRWLGREAAPGMKKNPEPANGSSGKPAPKRGGSQGAGARVQSPGNRRSRRKAEKEEAAARKERALLLASEPVPAAAVFVPVPAAAVPVPVAAAPAADPGSPSDPAPHRLHLLEAREPIRPPAPLRPSRSGGETWNPGEDPGAGSRARSGGGDRRRDHGPSGPRARPDSGPPAEPLPPAEEAAPVEPPEMLARQSPAAGRQPPAAEPVPVAAAGAAREANAPAPAIAEQPERAAPAAPWPDGPARRGSGGTWRERLLRAGEAIFGAAWPAILDRVVHLRVSTLLALLMAGVITIVLFLTYLKLPPQENALVSNFLESSPRPAGGEAEGGPAAGPRLVDPAALPAAPGPSGGARQVLVRPVPLWSPGAGGVEGEAGSPQRATEPEIRNVEPAVPPAGGEGTAPGETATANGAAAPEGGDAPAAAPRSPHLYLIQVKAKESGEEAERILEYLGLLGFGDPRVEHKGDRHADGTKLYTVFVGSFEEEKQARRECERLRRETRRRPYRDREDFFADALVITRARR